MKSNPGGQIPPSEVIGRDKLIQNLWRILERQSLVLSAERRMGKTCIVKKMTAEVPAGKLPIYHDLEGIRTPLEFVEAVFHDVEGHLDRLRRTAGRMRQFMAQLSGGEFKGLKLPDSFASYWKTLLAKTIEDVVEQDSDVILLWDEVPLMLYNIKKRNGEDTATEVLDMLRSLRQTHSGLRMVFTGSIGLHNVITSLKQVGYANDPTNDMDTVDVPPLSPADAQELARRLLAGENIPTDDPRSTAEAIAVAVGGIPYYIHHVVDQVAQREGIANAATVNEIVDICLTDPLDRWHLRHYRDRIDTYYDPNERPFVLNLLDILAVADQPLPFDDLFNLLKSRIETEDIEMTRHVLTQLQRDHYVIQQTDGTFLFRFMLIKRWWKLHRGLAT